MSSRINAARSDQAGVLSIAVFLHRGDRGCRARNIENTLVKLVGIGVDGWSTGSRGQ